MVAARLHTWIGAIQVGTGSPHNRAKQDHHARKEDDPVEIPQPGLLDGVTLERLLLLVRNKETSRHYSDMAGGLPPSAWPMHVPDRSTASRPRAAADGPQRAKRFGRVAAGAIAEATARPHLWQRRDAWVSAIHRLRRHRSNPGDARSGGSPCVAA